VFRDAHARIDREGAAVTNAILALGPPPLTEDAADAALDAIDFIAAAVRGVDVIDVTPTVRALWRQHLADWYGQLDMWTRGWYANAPFLVATIRTQWPVLNPLQRAATVQQWSVQLPAMLWMLEPVLAQAQANDLWSQRIRDHLSTLPEQVNRPTAEPVQDGSVAAIRELSQNAVTRQILQTGSTSMANATMDLMRAMSHH
jgi:hypothetical protein